MERWGVLRRFSQPAPQVNAPSAAAEAAEEPKREDPEPPTRPLTPPVEEPLDAGYYKPPVEMAPQYQNPPSLLLMPPEQPGDLPANERAPAVGISGRTEARSWMVSRPLADGSKGDYLGISYRPRLTKLFARYGDSKVLFADKVLKFTGTGKAKRQGLVITASAVYLIDPETDAVKRRIMLGNVNQLCLSQLTDNFLAIIVPSEYDCLLGSTRKKEIAQVLTEAAGGGEASGGGVDITFSNSFEYRPSALVEKEVVFEDLEGNVKTRILRKHQG